MLFVFSGLGLLQDNYDIGDEITLSNQNMKKRCMIKCWNSKKKYIYIYVTQDLKICKLSRKKDIKIFWKKRIPWVYRAISKQNAHVC